MKKENMFKKILVLALPATIGCTMLMAQSNARKTMVKDDAAVLRKKTELAAKHQSNGVVMNTNSATERTCVKVDKQKASIVTQAMLKKMPKDRQAFVKANPTRFTIVNY